MRWGYGRVSSKGQRLYGMSLEDQLERLLAQGIDQEHILLDTYTGTKIDRPKFNEVLSKLEPGDELVVCKLDRLPVLLPKEPCWFVTWWNEVSRSTFSTWALRTIRQWEKLW